MRSTCRPQKGWSPKNGQIMLGFPASSPAAVFPYPPWCTTALTCGKSQLCGAVSMNRTDSDCAESVGSIPPQPWARIARTPVRRTASKIICVACFGSRPKMLPNPKYTGGSSLDKNSVKDRGGFQPSAWLRNQYPVTVAVSAQSSGGGMMWRLNPCNAGIGRPSGSRSRRPGPGVCVHWPQRQDAHYRGGHRRRSV